LYPNIRKTQNKNERKLPKWQIEHEQYNDYARKAGLPEIDVKHLMKDRYIE